jgi:hypothetical protein
VFSWGSIEDVISSNQNIVSRWDMHLEDLVSRYADLFSLIAVYCENLKI